MAKPEPSSPNRLVVGTRTLSKWTSQWLSLARYPIVLRPRITVTPGVSFGTRIILCCWCFSGLSGLVFPITMKMVQRGPTSTSGPPFPAIQHVRISLPPHRQLNVRGVRTGDYSVELIKYQYIAQIHSKTDNLSLTSRRGLGRMELTEHLKPGTCNRRRVQEPDGCAGC